MANVKLDLATLLHSGCGLIVGLVAADGTPVSTRGWGLRLAEDERSARVLVGAGELAVAHPDPQAALGSSIAVTGAHIRSLRSAQLKGTLTLVEAVGPADLERMARYRDQYFAAVAEVDDTRNAPMERFVPDEVVACEFDVHEAFDQTPGPGAGASVDVGGRR